MHVGVVGAAGHEDAHAARLQRLQEVLAARDQVVLPINCAGFQALQAVVHRFHQAAVVLGLVPPGIVAHAVIGALLKHALGQPFHLKDGLDAGGFVDVGVHLGLKRRVVWRAVAGDHLQHQRPHHRLPAVAQRGDRAVKVEQRRANGRCDLSFVKQFHLVEPPRE